MKRGLFLLTPLRVALFLIEETREKKYIVFVPKQILDSTKECMLIINICKLFMDYFPLLVSFPRGGLEVRWWIHADRDSPRTSTPCLSHGSSCRAKALSKVRACSVSNESGVLVWVFFGFAHRAFCNRSVFFFHTWMPFLFLPFPLSLPFSLCLALAST